jgi:tetratricopeptide (TPR) repeat protein
MVGEGERFSYIGGDNFGLVITGDDVHVHTDRSAQGLQYLSSGKHHLRLGLHAKALDDFKRAMDTETANPEVYYLSAIATLGGIKAVLVSLRRIRECEALIHSALRLEPRGLFYYFLAYLAFDYYDRKGLRAPIPAHSLLELAWKASVTAKEIQSLFALLSVENPLPENFTTPRFAP